MFDNKTTLDELKSIVESFVDERNWQQFHYPKNLTMALSVEAAELMELFQWVSLDQAREVMKVGDVRENAIDEIADILIYTLAFCNRNKIDITDAIKKKMEKIVQKYPADKFNGHF